MEITKHISSTPLAKEPVLSLFGDHQERSALASKVILASKNISNGFELAFRIIQVCQQIYTCSEFYVYDIIRVGKSYFLLCAWRL